MTNTNDFQTLVELVDNEPSIDEIRVMFQMLEKLIRENEGK